jgi:hypothetical protein
LFKGITNFGHSPSSRKGIAAKRDDFICVVGFNLQEIKSFFQNGQLEKAKIKNYLAVYNGTNNEDNRPTCQDQRRNVDFFPGYGSSNSSTSDRQMISYWIFDDAQQFLISVRSSYAHFVQKLDCRRKVTFGKASDQSTNQPIKPTDQMTPTHPLNQQNDRMCEVSWFED